MTQPRIFLRLILGTGNVEGGHSGDWLSSPRHYEDIKYLFPFSMYETHVGNTYLSEIIMRAEGVACGWLARWNL